MKFKGISVIVPIFNEEGNIQPLLQRIDKTMKSAGLFYEVVFIDDHSTDKSREEVRQVFNLYPVSLFLKSGQKGKAFSLLEGFSYAKYPLIAMIDGDLQYPPEAIPLMVEKINQGADVVVAERKESKTSLLRKVFSTAFKTVFVKLLHGLNLDVQSGLKVFKKEIVERFKINPSPWTFDLEFLLKAIHAGYLVDRLSIVFTDRTLGQSKVKTFKAAWEIGWSALRMKLTPLEVIPLSRSENVQGFHYKGKRYVHHSSLSPDESAVYGPTLAQTAAVFLLGATIALAAILNWHLTVVIILAVITLVYFIDLLFNFYLIYRSFSKSPEISISDRQLRDLNDKELPLYTIFCPLYKEWEVLAQFVTAIDRLDYPKDKLQVILLLEEDDEETVSQARRFNLPKYFEIVVVPHSFPKTKPKACNYGLGRAKGEFIVVYDAEDIPDPKQLKKVFLAFQKTPPEVLCVQAKLNYYNPHQNILTRLFTAEYSLWFDLVLTGLQSINAPIPLGGTSNHFRAKDLHGLYGWDAFNVTEDCDLGMRLAKRGYKTAIVDSVTQEEANSEIKNWFNQRTRWVKGYIQTYLVHMRQPRQFIKTNNKASLFAFQLIVGGKVMSMLVNPLMWVISFSYFAFRPYIGELIESLFPTTIFYMGIFSMTVGNFLYFYYYMMGVAKRKQYELIKYVLLVPFYWLLMSAAAWVAVYRLIKQPYHWSKTKHGLHLTKATSRQQVVRYVGNSLVDESIVVQPINADD